MFRRILAFFARYPDLLGVNTGTAGTPLSAQRDALQTVVTNASNSATQQGVQKAQTTLLSKDEMRKRADLLQFQMGHITQVARALRGSVPGIGVLKKPDAHVSNATLVKSANEMAQNAAPFQDVLVQHGLPQDFIAQLIAAGTAVAQSVDARGSARALMRNATTDITSEVSRGRRIVTIMNAAMKRALVSDPARLDEWKQAKHVPAKGIIPAPTTAPASGTSAAAGAVASPTTAPVTQASAQQTAPVAKSA